VVTKVITGWRYFHGAGKIQASSNPQDMRLQRMLGHLSVLTRPDPGDVKDVLVVACGAGVTAGSFIPYPEIERITVCDIEPLVPKVVAPMFGEENYHIVDGIDKENPHMVDGKEVRVVYDDGRHYIRTLPKDVKFDIITSDPIDPWVKGCAALNTIEYYEMCKEHLKPGGVMTLWMPLYESDEATVKSLITTFFKVFPNGVFFSNDLGAVGYDAVLLGYVEPVKIDLDRLHETLNSPEYQRVKESLTEVGFGADTASLKIESNVWGNAAISLLATYAGRAADMGEWMEGAQINTDRNLRLQYLAGMSVNTQTQTEILTGILKYYKFPEDIIIGSPDNIQTMKVALQSKISPSIIGGSELTFSNEPSEDSKIGYRSVDEALFALTNKEGVSIRKEQGWTIITDKNENSVWSFTPENHPAYPAVVKRTTFEENGAVYMKMDVLCQASQIECAELVKQFQQ